MQGIEGGTVVVQTVSALRPGQVRRLVAAVARQLLHRSDYRRWSDPNELRPAWDARVQNIARLVPRGSRVIEFGAGRRQLESLLDRDSCYVPSDLVDRGPGTLVCDLNKRPLPAIEGFDVAVFSGVLEYLFDVPAIIRWLSSSVPVCIASYACARREGRVHRLAATLQRATSGWVNSYTEQEILNLFVEAGYSPAHRTAWDAQCIWLFTARHAVTPRERGKDVA
jgi:hypothetical protein